MAELDHALVFTSEFDRTIEHPDGDREGCDFDAYADRDWTRAAMGLGTYRFTWVAPTDEIPAPYWNGTYFG